MAREDYDRGFNAQQTTKVILTKKSITILRVVKVQMLYSRALDNNYVSFLIVIKIQCANVRLVFWW